jgi:hypothetical protein
MRGTLLIAAAVLAAAASGCDGGSGSTRTPTAAGIASSAVATAVATAPAASKSPPSTPAAVTSAQTATDEVTGIVGSVNVAAHTIQIDRLSGAPVTRITVDAGTVIRVAGGGTTTLGSVRVSDRIIASGHLNDRNDALVATEITVQAVVPGGQPGG